MDILYAFLPYVLSFGVFFASYKEFLSRGIHDMLGITLFFGSIIFLVGMLVYVLLEVPEYTLYAEIGIALAFLVVQFIKPKESSGIQPPKEIKKPTEKKTITLEDILGE